MARWPRRDSSEPKTMATSCSASRALRSAERRSVNSCGNSPSPVASQRTAAASCPSGSWMDCVALRSNLTSWEFSRNNFVPKCRMPARICQADQRILIRRIVADDEDSFGLIKLLHRERAFRGAITKRGDQPGVIRSAMMINIVRAKGRARQALKQVILLV